MRSRWGSCHYTKGVVVLSSHLLAKPRAAVEYVVLHELCHFIHPDHSQAFYGLAAAHGAYWFEPNPGNMDKQRLRALARSAAG